ncbi:hypothetical protein E2562_027342 [Oryza meyeriana var. granulata]|uniref:Uncharacterized protein n=1 Tax=Oryza meyeriana var. granulata TaxID=110450 RepID=A0A6G1E4N7_9ORYZ|nr:hypothetical protein E2562_027342 [Oryza meyeriana var. granulata]
MAVAQPEEEDNSDRWALTPPVGGTGGDGRGKRAAMLGRRGEVGLTRKAERDRRRGAGGGSGPGQLGWAQEEAGLRGEEGGEGRVGGPGG